MQYELVTIRETEMLKLIDDNEIESWIPIDPANGHYQAYLNKDTLPSNSSTPQAGA